MDRNAQARGVELILLRTGRKRGRNPVFALEVSNEGTNYVSHSLEEISTQGSSS